MNKKQIRIMFIMTAVVVALLSVFVCSTITSVNNRMAKYSFSELTETTKNLASDLYDNTDMDRTLLTAVAQVIAGIDDPDDAYLCTILNTYISSPSYLSYMELLRPDNTILDSKGMVRNVSAVLDFDEESQKGKYISDVTESIHDPEEKVILNAVPVVKNGRIIYILYGVVNLSDLAVEYDTQIYNGHAYVYLEDGNTGDLLLDTWNKSDGNISDFYKRNSVAGYSFKDAVKDMNNGKAGDMSYKCEKSEELMYMHYEPVGINNWNVIVTVEQEFALHDSVSVSKSLYLMACIGGNVFLFYMICVIVILVKAYLEVQRLGTLDQTTGLNNRNAYDKFYAESKSKTFESIVCIFIDVNGLHEVNNKYGHKAGDEMLRFVADCLKKNFKKKTVFRIGGDEFVVLCESISEDDCIIKIETAKEEIEAKDYHIAVGVACFVNETGIERVTQEADKKMLEDKRYYYLKHDRRSTR